MSRLRPIRNPPPIAPPRITQLSLPNVQPSDTSISSNSSLALTALTSDDIRIIDEIIERAPGTVTAFLPVFKAYGEVLQEQGIDASADVVYYRFLLKLGVVRGSNWGERWQSVKNQLNGQSVVEDDHDDDSSSVHSLTHTDDHSDFDTQSTSFVTSTPQPRRVLPRTTHSAITPRIPKREKELLHTPRPHSPPTHKTPRTTTRPRAQTQLTTPRLLNRPTVPSPLVPTPRGAISRDPSPASSTPPSYRTYAPEKTPVSKVVQPSPHPRTLAEFAQAAAKAGKVRLNVGGDGADSKINAEETWKVLRMEQEADDFRRYTLMRKCWDVWVQGVQWMMVRISHFVG